MKAADGSTGTSELSSPPDDEETAVTAGTLPRPPHAPSPHPSNRLGRWAFPLPLMWEKPTAQRGRGPFRESCDSSGREPRSAIASPGLLPSTRPQYPQLKSSMGLVVPRPRPSYRSMFPWPAAGLDHQLLAVPGGPQAEPAASARQTGCSPGLPSPSYSTQSLRPWDPGSPGPGNCGSQGAASMGQMPTYLPS